MSFFSLAAIVGGLVAAVSSGAGNPFLAFNFGAFIAFLITIGGAMLDDDVETNEYAIVKNSLELEAASYSALDPETPQRSFTQLLKIKLQIIRANISEPIILRFLCFMLLQGLCMPTFDDYQYFFVTQILGISKFEIGLLSMFVGVALLGFPMIYNNYYKDSEYRNFFLFSQIMSVFAFATQACQAMRWNVPLGISDNAIFVFSGSFANTIERVVTIFPSYVMMARMVPPGVEGTMMAVNNTLVHLNQFTIRNLLGKCINDAFVHVGRNSLHNYYILPIIAFAGSILPLFYMMRMIPSNQEVAELEEK